MVNKQMRAFTPEEFEQLYQTLSNITYDMYGNDSNTRLTLLSQRIDLIGCRCTIQMLQSDSPRYCLSCQRIIKVNDYMFK